jgi:prepilin-type N-terminal cleavage/methylation domain-containing protein
LNNCFASAIIKLKYIHETAIFLKRLLENNQAFTLIEILIVLSIWGLLLAMAIPLYGNVVGKEDLQSETTQLLYSIRLAQERSIHNQNNSSWGIYFINDVESDSYFVFRGDVYDSGDPKNQLFELSSGISFDSIELNNSSETLVFEQYEGGSLDFGSITLKDEKQNRISISINEFGTTDVTKDFN